MASQENKEPLRITAEDLATVTLPEPVIPGTTQPVQSGGKSYGSIADASDQSPLVAEESGSILLKGWFYLGAAGFLGALAGWAICEPWFVDGAGHRWGNVVIMPMIVMLMCVGFGVSESLVERSAKKALLRGLMALPLGIGLGFVFDFIAELIYLFARNIVVAMGVESFRNPAAWIARGAAWMVFGLAGGVVYGIVGQSVKKAKFGILGGIIGAGLGGILFDPIAMMTHHGGPSRAVGFALFGMATGVGIGLVESALKDRWLYVTSGPLAGKQFILYKPQTSIGSLQQCDIYLFKDPGILPQHAILEFYGSRVQLRAGGPVYVSGQPVSTRVLMDGDLIQIGRYSFRYKERHRS
jgi:hypothetical protein